MLEHLFVSKAKQKPFIEDNGVKCPVVELVKLMDGSMRFPLSKRTCKMGHALGRGDLTLFQAHLHGHNPEQPFEGVYQWNNGFEEPTDLVQPQATCGGCKEECQSREAAQSCQQVALHKAVNRSQWRRIIGSSAELIMILSTEETTMKKKKQKKFEFGMWYKT